MTRPEGFDPETRESTSGEPAPSEPAPDQPAAAPATGTAREPADDEPTTAEVEPTTGSVAPAGSTEELSGTLAALTADDLDQSERRRLLGRLAGQIRARGIGDLFRPRAAMRWVADAVGDIAPRIPLRDGQTLRRHHPGISDEALAERLIRNAARTTAAVGAASGGVAAIEWIATPTLLSAPVLLAAETVAVVAIEMKLIGELHELYGEPIRGGTTERAVALVRAWAERRGVNPMLEGMGAAAVLGTAARRELRDRLLRRFGRNLTTYGPMLTGAAVASYLNRRATLSLGQQIRRDLSGRARTRLTQPPALPGSSGPTAPGAGS
jgi:hypothetical protein